MTLYEILEVSEKASYEIIEKAYKTLAKKYHPDLQQEQSKKVDASEKMKKINEAYAILSDTAKRQEYDAKLEAERRRAEAVRQQNVQYYQQQDNYESSEKRQSQEKYHNENNIKYKQGYVASNWRDELSHLTDVERRKITKKIQNAAKQEYEAMYRNYFRSLGYKVKHKITLKGIISVVILTFIASAILWILWIIPTTHQYMMELYKNNIAIKILVDLVIRNT